MLVIGLALSLFIGVSLGLLGGGGSILTLPVLLYVFDLAPKSAIATSLLVVGTTSLAALIPHARAHHVRWKTGMVFGLSGMLGAYAGGLCGAYISSDLLITAFIAMMIATSLAMWSKSKTSATSAAIHATRPLTKITLDGLVIGLVTGLVGAGGGFLVVPALVLLGGLSMPAAIGTSLMVIAMKSFAGFAGYASHVEINVQLAGMVTAAAVCGSAVGAHFVRSVNPNHLRRGFSVFVMVMAVYMASRELPALLGRFSFDTPPAVSIVLAIALLAVVPTFLYLRRRRRHSSLEFQHRTDLLKPQTLVRDELI